MTEIRVGFMPAPANPNPRIRPGIRPLAWRRTRRLLLFLSARPDVDFYHIPANYDVVDKKAGNFAADLAEAKRCVKLMADPDAGPEVGQRRGALPDGGHARDALPHAALADRPGPQDGAGRRRPQQGHPDHPGRRRLGGDEPPACSR